MCVYRPVLKGYVSLRATEHLRNCTFLTPSGAPRHTNALALQPHRANGNPPFSNMAMFQSHGVSLEDLQRCPLPDPGTADQSSGGWPPQLFPERPPLHFPPALAGFPSACQIPISLLSRDAGEEGGTPSSSGSFLFQFFLWFLTSRSPLSHLGDTASRWPAFGDSLTLSLESKSRG